MAALPQHMILVIDEHIPPPLVVLFRQRGHTTHLVTQSTIMGSPDEVVCALAEQLGAIVVTFDHKHYLRLLPRIPQSGMLRYSQYGTDQF
jgi:predicted nuclease of predicted toxin-antitoxin system